MKTRTIFITMAIMASFFIIDAMAANNSVISTSLDNIQQSSTVKGSVVDSKGEPIIGASILVKGTSNGTVSDFSGAFFLNNLKSGAVLVVSYVGCETQTLIWNGHPSIRVKMKDNVKQLDEVVVIGYGVQKKRDVTGAISSIKSDDMKNTVNTNAASSLQGKVSGVQVVNNSGAPGANPTIRVRGYSSNGSSDPLYIVDGLKVSDISYLDPNSVESIEVLKDAASAAIYGAEAGNGVVLITTKEGKKGDTKITFDAQWTFSSLAKKVKVMNAEQYTNYYREVDSETFDQLYNKYYIKGTDTDWQKEMYETGKMQKYNVGMEGGSDKGKFYINLGYMNNNGIVKLDKDFYRRFTGQINSSYKIRPWLEVGTNNTIINSKSSTISESNVQSGVMKNIVLSDPLSPVMWTASQVPQCILDKESSGLHPLKDNNGNYYAMPWMTGTYDNPLEDVSYRDDLYRIQTLNGMTYANIIPFKNFVFTTRLGYTLGNVSEDKYQPQRMTSFYANVDDDMSMTSTQYTVRYYQWENFFNYFLSTGKFGDFSVMAGMSYNDRTKETTGGTTNKLSSSAANFRYLNYSTNNADDYVKGNFVRQRQIAYYGRLGWTYLNRYNFQCNFRADSYDSAYLDLDHNWGYFPSVSAGWTFSEEDFMKGLKNSNVFNYGKLRVSWGVNGSISNLGNYMYAATMNAGQYDLTSNTANMNYYIDGQLGTDIYPNSTLANTKLRWERSKQYDLGLDLRFFNNRLLFTADYFNKITDGLLVKSTAPLTTGTSYVYQNLGKVKNNGLEFELEWHDHIGDFQYSVKGNISTLGNKVTKYKGKGTRISGSGLLSSESVLTYFEEGYPVWYIRGYKFTGVKQSNGEPIYQDTDGDGTITDNDRVNLGSGIPKLTYGINLSLAYKGLDLNIYGTGANGNKLVYGMMSTVSNSRTNRPMFLYTDRWTQSNTDASMPSATYQLNDPRFYNSSAFVFSAAFFKIKQIQLGYTLSKKLLIPLGVESLRAYVSLDNFFTFTHYPGSDPEVNASSNSSSAMALDYGGYPMSKSVSFGFNVSF